MIPVIFINCKDEPYIDAIMNGTKTYETRSKNTLKALLSWALGERVLIAETGNGAPVVRCSAVIDHFGAVYTKERWNELRKVHRVPFGSEYDWKPETKVKWLYHLSDVQLVAPFIPEGRRHGRTWMECNDRIAHKNF